MQVFSFVLDCLEYLINLTSVFLLYAIRLVGWVKHCELSLLYTLVAARCSTERKYYQACEAPDELGACTAKVS